MTFWNIYFLVASLFFLPTVVLIVRTGEENPFKILFIAVVNVAIWPLTIVSVLISNLFI